MLDPTAICMRCGRLGPTEPFAQGLLHLCPACPLAEVPCEAFAHQYRGSARSGSWVCTDCGQTISSERIKTEPVPGPAPADMA